MVGGISYSLIVACHYFCIVAHEMCCWEIALDNMLAPIQCSRVCFLD